MKNLQKYKYISTAIIVLLFIMMFPVTVFANSSWGWISETKPLDVFPIIVIITLVIETALINLIPKLKKLSKVFCIVTTANLLSFATPYLIEWLFWKVDGETAGYIYPFWEQFDTMPFYTTGIVFLIITLIVETPIVYFTLRKNADKQDIFLITTIGTNILTTIIVAIVERTLCYGHW